MANINELGIGIGVESKELKQGLDKAIKHTKKFSRKAQREGYVINNAFKNAFKSIPKGKILALGSAITSAFGVQKILSFTKALAKANDKLIKASRGAGIAFDDFQSLQFAFGQAGIDGRVLTKGLNKLNQAIIDGERGLCLLYTSPSPRDRTRSRMPSSA